MIGSDVIRGYTDTMILFLLLERPSYGYEISKSIQNLSDGEYKLKETTLYSAFGRLEKNGFIESFPGEVTFGKPRTYYRITQIGQSYYKDKCREWTQIKNLIERFIDNREE